MKNKKHTSEEGNEPGQARDDGQSVSVATASGEGPGVVSSSPDAVAEWQAKIASLEDGLLRARADLQNAQRRATSERLDAVRYANAELMKSLVQVVDDFQRALSTSTRPENLHSFVEGMRLVYENLSKALADHGLETVDALHKPFDPTLHEALMQSPTSEKPPGTVIEQVAKGYRLHGRVVRPAKVVVAKAPDTSAGPEQELDRSSP